MIRGEIMIDELSCLNYYSSGFKLDSLSYSKTQALKLENNYINKEEVITAKMALTITSSFFDKGGRFK